MAHINSNLDVGTSNQNNKKVKWDDNQRRKWRIFIDCMKADLHARDCPDSGFKSSQWSTIHEKFNKEANKMYDRQQLQS
jgi:hypothetical protein